VLLVAALVVPRILSGRANAAFNTLARSAGCGDGIIETGGAGEQDHLDAGETTEYKSLPPSDGAHASSTLPEGVYDEPLSDDANEDVNIYRAVHSLEHGAVIVWHNDLSDKDLDDITDAYADESKILVVPFPDMPGKNTVAMTAWGRVVRCEEASTDVIDAFVDRFREARTAPEPKNAI
jgi:hypothetical protein